ncbi:hypothetical protein HKX48_008101, partial [Thoreauomyces humboldtii]
MKNPHLDWRGFNKLLDGATKVIWMDGFLTCGTTGLIKDRGEEVFIIGSNVPPPERVIKFVEKTEDMYAKIFESLDNGERTFIACGAKNFKKTNKSFDGVENLVSTLAEKYNWTKGVEIIGYHAGRKKEKEALERINEVWGDAKVRVVVGNAALAIGVNYDCKKDMIPFDRVFGICNPSIIGYRDLFQLLARVRNPLSNEIWVQFSKPHAQSKLEAFCFVSSSSVFRNLNKIMEAERMADNDAKSASDIFAMYCKICNIRLDTGGVFSLSDEERTLISDSFSSDLNMFVWKNIEVIDHATARYIEELLESFTASVDDILQLQKYRFTNMFKPSVLPEAIEQYWNSQRDTVFGVCHFGKMEKGEKVYKDAAAATVIHQFYKDNGLGLKDSISARHVCHTPFSEIAMAFKFLKRPTTFRMDLYAKMLNAYFGDAVVWKDYKHPTKAARYTWTTE